MMSHNHGYKIDVSQQKHDVLNYIDWVWWLCEVEAHRLDPRVEWNKDMSWDEMFDVIGIRLEERTGYGARPGHRIGTDLGTAQLYWPLTDPYVLK